jgi:hypothetical protein
MILGEVLKCLGPNVEHALSLYDNMVKIRSIQASMGWPHNPLKAKGSEEEKSVPWIPQYLGHWGTKWAPDIDARKDSQRNVCQPKKSGGSINSDGHLLVDRMKGYHEATEKQVD